MCGIAGVFHYQDGSVDRDALCRVNQFMQKRGPDGSGVWTNESDTVGLAHRRLSIIDLSDQARQPMHRDGLSITFNGEIYNYRMIRNTLIQAGITFKTTSDTEVLLALYLLHREDMLRYIRGMFAFAIWDEKNQTLFCARDHFGIKPFYYINDGKSFRFASQVKALLQYDIDTTFSAAGMVGYHLLGSIPEPHTMYQNIMALPAGHFSIIKKNKNVQMQSYYSIKNVFAAAEHAEKIDLSLSEAVRDSVKHHLVADVDVGLFLSAGIDSSLLASVASDLLEKKLHSVTLGFHEYRNTPQDETMLASRVADAFQTTHHTAWITRADAVFEKNRIFGSMDQPSIDGINTYFVSKVAAMRGMKVALSGLGADELFSGYPHFARIEKMLRYAKPFAAFGKLTRMLSHKIVGAKKASLLEWSRDITHAYFLSRAICLPWELHRQFSPEFWMRGFEELNLFERMKKDIEGIRSVRFQISALEMQWYMRNQLLRDTDWASMAHSLEVRVPFVDVHFFENCVRIIAATNARKKELALATNRALPLEIIARKKTGFSIPIRTWLQPSNKKNDVATWARYACTESLSTVKQIAL